jgi:hypothetical protein
MNITNSGTDNYPSSKVSLILMHGLPGETREAFSSRMMNDVTEKLKGQGADSLRVTLTVEKPPLSLFPFRKNLVALFTCTGLKKTGYTDASLPGIYMANQTVPLSPENMPLPGRTTDGVCMLTLFNKKHSIDRETFFSRWFGHHTPYSLKHFPLTGYVRNSLDSSVDEAMPRYDAFVEEFFSCNKDLIQPWRFFNSLLLLPLRLLELYLDVTSFIDMRTIETYYCRYYRIK